jgi:tetratricopeptide (TPR) repeat protein
MIYHLLLVDGQGAAMTAQLRIRTLREFPGQEGLSVHFRPVRNDLLFESAKKAGWLAYRILAGEGKIRSQLWIEYELLAQPLNVIGRSSDLLFALALINAAWKVESGEHAAIAATGVLNDEGNVQSVEHVAEKVAAAVRDARSLVPLTVYYPAADAALVDAWRMTVELPPLVHLQPVAHLEDALAHLGYHLENVYLRNPFRGLEHFEFADHSVFFGRDREMQEVLAQLLRREKAGQPGLLIEGASGSGKSSFLRAGVLPALVNVPAHDEDVRDAIKRRPIGASVALAIWQPGLPPADADERRLAMSIRDCWARLPEFPPGCMDHVETFTGVLLCRREHWPSRQRFVWLIDQFEELFNASLNPAVLELFGHFLKELQADGVWTLASIRADATPRLKTYESLRGIFGSNEGEYYLGTLSGPALDDVITRPAKAADLTFEVDADGTRLDRRLREDAYREKNSLPLLQFTLNELYLKRSGMELTYAAYNSFGGLAGSIAAAAESVMAGDAGTSQVAARLFRSLVSVDDDGRPVRRYAPMAELSADPEQRHLLLRLVQARLCVTDQHDGNAVAAFAHDALLSTLPALSDWLRHEAALLQTRDLARHDTREWEKHAESDAWLAAADKLSTFVALESAEIVLPQSVRKFLERSRQRVRRVTRIKQIVAASIAVLALTATIFGIRFKLERDAALSLEHRALLEAQTAQETSNFLIGMFKVTDPGESRGNTITAREILDRGAEQIRTQLGGQPAVKARMLLTIGEVYGDLGLGEKSLPLMEEALVEASRPGIANDVEIAMAEQALGHVLTGREEYVDAERHLLEAVRIFDSHPELSGDSALVRRDLGYHYWVRGDYVRAQPVFEEALKRAEARFGRRSEEVASILSNFGKNIRDLGDPSQGLRLLEESADIYKAVQGEDYYWYGVTRESIGFTLLALGRNEEAKANLSAGIKVHEHVLGPNHGLLGQGLQGLGAAEVELGQLDEAEKTLKRALAIEEIANGPESNEVGRTLRYLAGAYAAQQEFDKAMPLFRRSLSIAKRRFGELSEEYDRDLLSLGISQRRSGRLHDAEETIRQAVAIAERQHDSPATLSKTLSALADILCFRRPDAEGFALTQRAIDLHATRVQVQLAVVKSTSAYCDPDRSHVDENEAALNGALQEVQMSLGPTHPQTEDVTRRLKRFRQAWRKQQA